MYGFAGAVCSILAHTARDVEGAVPYGENGRFAFYTHISEPQEKRTYKVETSVHSVGADALGGPARKAET